MNVKVEGFDEFNKKMNNLMNNAKSLEGEQQVSFVELFPDSFIRKYTNSDSLELFFKESGFKLETKADFDAIPQEYFDEYVRKTTKFQSFHEMLEKATTEYIVRKLGF